MTEENYENNSFIEEPNTRIDILSIVIRSIMATGVLWVLSVVFLSLVYFNLCIPNTIENKNIYYVVRKTGPSIITDFKDGNTIYLSKTADQPVERQMIYIFAPDYPKEKVVRDISDNDFSKIESGDYVSYIPSKGLRILSKSEASRVSVFKEKETPLNWGIKQIKGFMILVTGGLIFLTNFIDAVYKARKPSEFNQIKKEMSK